MARPSDLLCGTGCKKCADSKRTKTHKQFLTEVSNEITVLGTYVSKNTKVEVSCNSCGRIWKAVAQSLSNGSGCIKCSAKKRAQPRIMATKKRYGEVKELAWEYSDRSVFREAELSAYRYCVRHNLIEELTGHMVKNKGLWNIKTITAEALKYESRDEFQWNSGGAYKAARIKGVLDNVCSHMIPKKCDDNCLYIWKLVGEKWNDVQLYKIGVTSVRLDDVRIKQCAKSGNFEYDIVIMKEVKDARKIEKELLKYGINPKLTGFDGATEVRALSDVELDEILSTL